MTNSQSRINFWVRLHVSTILLLAAISACTAQLAPQYDQAIVDGLNTTNRDIQVLFASIGSNATKASFPSREDSYRRIIGSLNALVIQVEARPTPSTSVNLKDVNAALARIGVAQIANDPNFSDVPSARSIKNAADTIEHMQTADASSGLRGYAIKAFENQTNVYITQALVYETFLKR
jgi:hypothetical protein